MRGFQSTNLNDKLMAFQLALGELGQCDRPDEANEFDFRGCYEYWLEWVTNRQAEEENPAELVTK